MTRIDFHTNIPDKVAYVCRLARKACSARGKLILLTADAAQAAALNAGLWTIGETDFLPHAMAGDALAAQSPIIITDSIDGEFPHYDILVNLSAATPNRPDRFARVFEIVSTDEQDVAAGRTRYAAYKQQSYAVTHFVAS